MAHAKVFIGQDFAMDAQLIFRSLYYALAFVFGVAQVAQSSISKAEPPHPLRIGIAVSESGRGRAVADSVVKGVDLALTGHSATMPPIKFINSNVDELVNVHHVDVVLGPTDISSSTSAAQAAAKGNIPILSLTQDSGVINDWAQAYRAMPTTRNELFALIDAATRNGIKRIAVVYPSTRYGEFVKTAVAQHASTSNAQVVLTASYAPHDARLKESLKTLSHAAIDAIVIAGAPEDVMMIAPSLAALGLRIGMSDDSPNSAGRIQLLVPSAGVRPHLIKSAARYFEGAYLSIPFFAESEEPHIKTFVADFEQRYHRKPDVFSALAFDMTRLTLAAWALSEPPGWPLNLTHVMLATATCVKGFKATHEPREETQIFTLRAGVLVPLP